MASYTRTRSSIEQLLSAEAAAADPEDRDALLARVVGPGLFDPAVDHDDVARLLSEATAGGGWWRRRRARKAAERARRVARAGRTASADELAMALDVARGARAAAAIQAGGGLTLDGAWDDLVAAEQEARVASGEWLAAEVGHVDRRGVGGGEAMTVVAAALRGGRARRRELLASIPGEHLARAMPIWVATLADIEDLLPPAPAMFDVAIIDEAAQVDQPSAAVALVRARRGVLVGDPNQLRHVSFLADVQIAAALSANGLDGHPLLAARLDLRRMTVFDAAAGTAPVHVLDVHYRSAPHLIAFSSRHFYDGRLRFATAHPARDRSDHIDVIAVDGTRDADGVNDAEVDRVVALLQEALAGGERSVGVVTPFRAHADALERAAGAALSLDELERLGLRIGTVHGFQGCERDHVIVSLAADDVADLGFVNDPNLFNVMVTRARTRLTVVTSLGDQATGLTRQYLDHAERHQRVVEPARAARGWVGEVAGELARLGIDVVAHYPVGDDDIDLVVGAGDAALGVECTVHPAGPSAHVDRHVALLRAGWRLRDFYSSRWRERLAEVTVRLATDPAGRPVDAR